MWVSGSDHGVGQTVRGQRRGLSRAGRRQGGKGVRRRLSAAPRRKSGPAAPATSTPVPAPNGDRVNAASPPMQSSASAAALVVKPIALSRYGASHCEEKRYSATPMAMLASAIYGKLRFNRASITKSPRVLSVRHSRMALIHAAERGRHRDAELRMTPKLRNRKNASARSSDQRSC